MTEQRSLLNRLHLDGWLLFFLLCLMGVSLVVVYSASGQSAPMMERQMVRLALALGVTVLLAQIPLIPTNAGRCRFSPSAP